MSKTIKFKRGSETNIVKLDGNIYPKLEEGEPAIDTTNREFKIGDGVTEWSNLGGFKEFIKDPEDTDILKTGQIGIDTSRGIMKLGDGNSKWGTPDSYLEQLKAVPEGWVNVKDFGAKGDGETDDTLAFLEAINTGKNIYVPKSTGSYRIDPSLGLSLKSNTIIFFEEGAILENLPHDLTHYSMLLLKDIENVTIYNPQLNGRRDLNSATDGEWGMGIYMQGAKNIKIYNANIENCWGDGMAFGKGTENDYCEDIYISFAKVNNNRRNGYSLASIKNFYAVTLISMNTNGTSPQKGLDIEPNDNNEYLENIHIENYISINDTFGVGFYLNSMANSSNKVSIIINNLFIEGGSGLSIKGYGTSDNDKLDGNIIINNYYVKEVRAQGMTIYKQKSFPYVKINNMTAENPFQNYDSSSAYSTIISFRDTDNPLPDNLTIGGISINNLEIYLTDKLNDLNRLFYINSLNSTIKFEDIYIHIIKSNNELPIKISNECENVTIITDNEDYLRKDLDTTIDLTSELIALKFTNSKFTSNRTVNIGQNTPAGIPITFEIVNENYAMTIQPDVNTKIAPLSPTLGQAITSNELGARLTLKRISDDTFIITEIIGTWNTI